MSRYQNGVMPTDEWFKKIKAHVNFKGKSVIDYGCAEGQMCILAKKAGASHVLGIDDQHDHIDECRQIPLDIDWALEDITTLSPLEADIKIFSMIIHWIGKEDFKNHLAFSKKVVVIFRTPDSGYEEQNGIFFPTLEELDKLVGGKRIHSEHLMNQGDDKNIVLAIYDKA